MTTKLIPLLLMAIVTGCTKPTPTPPAAPAPTFTHTITIDTEYYTDGPQQARPPDGKLKAGTKVNLVQDAGSYCRVKSEDEIEAYVAAGSVKAVVGNGGCGLLECNSMSDDTR
jgi:hypothetical protein